jgi:hypothetical protein
MAARLFSIVSIALIVLLALPLAGAAPLAEGKSRKKTITKTFSNSEFITIPAQPGGGVAGPYPSTIQVKKLKKGKIKDINVILRNYNLSNPDNASIMLTATHLPGRTATIMSEAPGSPALVDVTITLDDSAAEQIPSRGPIASGSFQPTNRGLQIDNFPAPAPTPSGNALLNVFNGGKANGTWQLFVFDHSTRGGGSLAGGWSLEITAKVKEKGKKN